MGYRAERIPFDEKRCNSFVFSPPSRPSVRSVRRKIIYDRLRINSLASALDEHRFYVCVFQRFGHGNYEKLEARAAHVRRAQLHNDT